jgi:phospholipid/cholesterol/gamma-HCH transport system ATP-binding protein
MPAELSGGMKKRAGIARAIAMDPEAIFYDEPSAGLDPIVAAGIDELIRNLQGTFDLTSVVVTHEMESVKLIADRVCVLHRGKVAGLGTLDELQQAEHSYIQQFFARRPSHEVTNDSDYARSLTGAD